MEWWSSVNSTYKQFAAQMVFMQTKREGISIEGFLATDLSIGLNLCHITKTTKMADILDMDSSSDKKKCFEVEWGLNIRDLVHCSLMA